MNIIENSAFWSKNSDYSILNSVQKVFSLQNNTEDNITCDSGGSGGCASSGCSDASYTSCASAE